MPNWIGDAVMATAPLRLLKQEFPEVSIDIVVKPWIAGLFSADPDLNAVMIYDPPRGIRRIWAFWSLIKQLKQKRYDAALLFQNAFEAALMAYLARIPKRIGYARDKRGFLLTYAPEYPLKSLPDEHQLWYFTRLVSGLGIEPVWRMPKIHISVEALEKIQHLFKTYHIEDSVRVALFPGAAYGQAKCWPVERFTLLGKRLRETRSAAVILLGSSQDSPLCFQVEELGHFDFINLCSTLSLEETMALVSQCQLCIANDSGGMHLAAALGTPTIGIFGPTDPRGSSPCGPRAVVVQGKADCAPCLYRECPVDHACMLSISVDAVYQRCQELLDGIND